MAGEYRFSNGTRALVGPSWVVTTLPGGQEVHAHPDAASAPMALRLGYAGDVEALTRDHDLIHSWLADELGLPQSISLAQTAGLDVPGDLAGLEEDAVLAVQRYICALRSRGLLPHRLFEA